MVAIVPLRESGGDQITGTDAHDEPRRLSSFELRAIARALELSWPSDALVKGVVWAGNADGKRNYRVTSWALDASPICSTWIAERAGDVYRLVARPANADELEALLDALRELDALDADSIDTIAEAHYDCRNRTYQLCFTPLEGMLENLAYKRWVFRRHDDGRPLSVGYICETRRGDAYATLPGGAILRGNPWSD